MNIDSYKVSTWFDTDKDCEKYGIKVRVEVKGKKKWMDAGDNDGRFFFDNKLEAKKKIVELKAERSRSNKVENSLLVEGEEK